MSEIERLREYFKYKKLKQQEVADILETSRARVANILSNNDEGISINLLKKIGKVFPDLNIDWLMLGRGDMLVPGHGLQKEYEIKEMVQQIVREEMSKYKESQNKKQ